MKQVDVKPNTYINNSSKEINDKDLKFKIGDSVRISKYKNIFAKVYVPNLKNLKTLWLGHNGDLNGELNREDIKDLKEKEILGTVYEEELQKVNQRV